MRTHAHTIHVLKSSKAREPDTDNLWWNLSCFHTQDYKDEYATFVSIIVLKDSIDSVYSVNRENVCGWWQLEVDIVIIYVIVDTVINDAGIGLFIFFVYS